MSEIIIKNDDFKLKDTFDCGQCFRWDEEEDGSFVGVAGSRCARLSERDGEIVIKSSQDNDGDFWKSYLDIERDYGEIKRRVSVNDLGLPDRSSFRRRCRRIIL